MDLDSVNDNLNRIPMGAIDYKYSVEALKEMLSQSII
jgi:hypothetical protein